MTYLLITVFAYLNLATILISLLSPLLNRRRIGLVAAPISILLLLIRNQTYFTLYPVPSKLLVIALIGILLLTGMLFLAKKHHRIGFWLFLAALVVFLFDEFPSLAMIFPFRVIA